MYSNSSDSRLHQIVSMSFPCLCLSFVGMAHIAVIRSIRIKDYVPRNYGRHRTSVLSSRNSNPFLSDSNYPPPSKKRRKNNQKAKQNKSASNSISQRAEFLKSTGASSKQQPEEEQWDTDPNEVKHGYDEGEEGEESRELTHEEIWDDSTLVNAWEAATQKYEAYHGPDKGWKMEPVNKSPLSVSPLLYCQ